MPTTSSPKTKAAPAGVPDDSLVVAVVGRAQGLAGEVRLNPTSGDPERLLGLKRLWLAADGENGLARACGVRSMRVHGHVAVARLETVNDRTQAESLVHHEAWALRAELPSASEHEFDAGDALGARLYRVAEDGSAAPEPAGVIRALSTISGNDYFEIETEHGLALVPLVKAWLVELDLDGGRVLMRLPDGLLED